MDYHHYRKALTETLAQSEVPFPAAEYQARLDKVRQAMTEQGLDALLLTDPADINYLTGYHTFEVSVHACLVCTQEKLVLQVASIETGAAVVTAQVDEIIGYRWENLDEIIAPLADLLAHCQKIGIDGWSAGLRFGVIDALLKTIGRERFSEAGALVDAIRIVKSPAELEMLQESAFLEFGAAYQRYTAPMMRTAVTGTPNAALSATRDLCRSIFEALCDAMRPGNSFDAAAQAADALLAPHRDQYFFSGVFGYAVGAQFPPSWVEGTGFIAKGQHRPFEANMVFHLPLCLRVPGQWGVGISDTVVVTEQGAKPLTNSDWQLFKVHG